ncbi:DUF4148 domain-containing protein [Caenimonas soli]|uniref:DUF4148 domain-containing protein n=1 Tax=Caenimonas soli TaxID=2735555 RepID=UPI00155391FB|nr:DUF4148 domain-containing protein [Caenimonas soli]NPC56323.1 DUF4148 domain-containing protein [Caenimonas soli]
MNRHLASTLSVTTTAAAALAFVAIASSRAHADDITVDNTPFVSSKTRAEVQAEVMGPSRSPNIASLAWSSRMNHAPQTMSDFTRAQATAEYLAARDQVHALNAEDSGSSYFASVPRRMNDRILMGQTR